MEVNFSYLKKDQQVKYLDYAYEPIISTWIKGWKKLEVSFQLELVHSPFQLKLKPINLYVICNIKNTFIDVIVNMQVKVQFLFWTDLSHKIMKISCELPCNPSNCVSGGSNKHFIGLPKYCCKPDIFLINHLWTDVGHKNYANFLSASLDALPLWIRWFQQTYFMTS